VTPVLRRIRNGGPISFGRGLQIEVTFDDASYRGTGEFLLGMVLEQFFARYVSINSFTETVIRTLDRGEIARWPARTGQRPIL
jgi:type VI secretion system protein ImpG